MALSKLPSKIDGTSYVAQWQRLNDRAADANGVDPVQLEAPLAGGFAPRLSNLEALAICQAWRRAGARTASRAGAVTSMVGVYELELAALGWQKEGDKFKVWSNAPGWPGSPFDDGSTWLLGHAWWVWVNVATELDERGTKIAPLYLDLTKQGYERAAREVYSRMLNDGPPGSMLPPLPDEPPPSPIDPGDILPRTPGLPLWMWLLIGYGAYRAVGGGPLITRTL
jgi:hypothetical protein